jgi:hypothetical protein
MLIVPNIKVLDNDAFLTHEEAAIRLRERNEQVHRGYRLSEHDVLKDKARRGGQWIHSSEFILKVLRLNPLVWVEHQINFPDDWGFYTSVQDKKVFVCQFPKGWMREFTAIDVDDRDLGTEKIHGWRQVLVSLIGKGVLTWEQVHKAFGDAEGLNSDTWLKKTTIFRHKAGAGQIQRNITNESANFRTH